MSFVKLMTGLAFCGMLTAGLALTGCAHGKGNACCMDDKAACCTEKAVCCEDKAAKAACCEAPQS